jgi:hypothetical protein
MLRFVALLVVSGLLGCATPPQGHAGVGGLDASSFAALALSFTDPETLEVYRVEGPYRVLRSAPDAIELEGFGADYYETTQLLLFMREDALWARAWIDGHEFLARVDAPGAIRQ